MVAARIRIGLLFGLAMLFVSGMTFGQRDRSYDFQKSPEFQKLTPFEKSGLMKVHHDLVLIWGALDLFASEHDGDTPDRLADLVPRYLEKVPDDPFAKPDATQRAYYYKKGNPKGWSWVVGSIGLPEYPYTAPDNQGLFRIRGIWISGFNLTR
jgi:hypothetical protein